MSGNARDATGAFARTCCLIAPLLVAVVLTGHQLQTALQLGQNPLRQRDDQIRHVAATAEAFRPASEMTEVTTLKVVEDRAGDASSVHNPRSTEALSPKPSTPPSPKRPLSSAPPPPNVLLVMADDTSRDWLSAYGGSASTPHIDSLSTGVPGRFVGARFTTFWAQPMCTPSRVQLLTGQYPFSTGSCEGLDCFGRVRE